MKYFFTGAQGTGKTSIMNALPDTYKKLQGITRKCILENQLDFNQNGNNLSQKMIFDTYERELSRNDDYIAERSLIDVYAYTVHQMMIGKCSPTLAETQLSHIEKFIAQNPDSVYFYLPIEFKPVADGIRSVDEKFQKDIDKIIFKTLNSTKVKYITLHGSVAERTKQVENTIKSNNK